MMRRVYRCLLWLHPAAFRRQFEEEMLWIFDEAAGAWGAASLFSDASVSLVRRWVLRLELWRWVVAGIAGIIPLTLAFGSFCRGTGPWVVDPPGALAITGSQEGGILVEAVAEDCS